MSTNFLNNNCAVVVSSFDGNEDIWKPFFTLLFKFWPDCPFPVYLIANEKKYDDLRVTTISIGEDHGWASDTKKALEHIATPYILFLLEDFLLNAPVETSRLVRLLALMKEHRAAYLRLAEPAPDEPFDASLDVGRISTPSDTRVSLHAAYWDANVLRSLIRDGENAWQMEKEGTIRSRPLTAPFLSTYEPALKYQYLGYTAITRGKWVNEAVQFCKSQGIYVNPARPINYALSKGRRMDNMRKKKFARIIKRIPVLGRLIGNAYWKFSRWYVNHT